MNAQLGQRRGLGVVASRHGDVGMSAHGDFSDLEAERLHCQPRHWDVRLACAELVAHIKLAIQVGLEVAVKHGHQASDVLALDVHLKVEGCVVVDPAICALDDSIKVPAGIGRCLTIGRIDLDVLAPYIFWPVVLVLP